MTPHPGRPSPRRPTASRETIDARLHAEKKRFLAALECGTVALGAAAQEIGRDPSTIWRWRQSDPVFDVAVRDATRRRDEIRVGMAEDAVFARCLGPDASPAEVIFFLVNRSHGRWRHVQTIVHTGADSPHPEPRGARHAAAAVARVGGRAGQAGWSPERG